MKPRLFLLKKTKWLFVLLNVQWVFFYYVQTFSSKVIVFGYVYAHPSARPPCWAVAGTRGGGEPRLRVTLTAQSLSISFVYNPKKKKKKSVFCSRFVSGMDMCVYLKWIRVFSFAYASWFVGFLGFFVPQIDDKSTRLTFPSVFFFLFVFYLQPKSSF